MHAGYVENHSVYYLVHYIYPLSFQFSVWILSVNCVYYIEPSKIATMGGKQGVPIECTPLSANKPTIQCTSTSVNDNDLKSFWNLNLLLPIEQTNDDVQF